MRRSGTGSRWARGGGGGRSRPSRWQHGSWARGVATRAGTASGAPAGPAQNGLWSRTSAALWRRPWARATLLLTPPLAWFLLIYITSLAMLLITAFWTTNPFTTTIERTWTLSNFATILGTAASPQ